jgi:hypothetical protein
LYWQHWVQARRSADDGAVRTNLRSQGEQWRSLLTGEVKADDLLELRDYRQAFSIYVGQVADIYRKSPWLWGAFLALFAATGVGIWAIVHFAPKGAAVVAGIIAAGAGALGISWKTIAATAGKAAALLERPLLADGLSEAVKIAAFIPPIRMTPDQITELRHEVRKDERRAKRKPLPAEQPRQAIAAPPEQPQLPAAGNEPEGATAR